MRELILPVVIAIIGSSGLMSFFQFLITRKDKIGERLASIDNMLNRLEKDGCRTQLLILISDYPGRQDEIMKLAKHYFYDLKGDWYLTSLFEKWLKDNEMLKPSWFKE